MAISLKNGTYGTPPIVTDGLILALDAANPKCFSPGDTECYNLISGGEVIGANGTPSTGTQVPNPTYFPSYNGAFGGVFDFAGGKGMNVVEDLGSHTKVTLSAWIYKNTSGQNYFFDARNNGGIWFILNYSNINFNWGGNLRYNIEDPYNSAATDFVNNWLYVVATSDSGGTKLYLNGYEIVDHPTFNNTYESNSTVSENLGVNLRIGTRYTTSGSFTGYMGPIHIYDRILTQSEVNQNYNSLKYRFV